MISLKHIALSTAILLGGALVTPAAEVWAPGVSEEEGWYDYHKTGDNDGWDADTAMCWAASASNVISWWQNLNAASITSTVPLPQNEEIFDIFKGVFTNQGGKAEYAYRWWVTSDGWKAPDGDGWARVGKDAPQEYQAYSNGGFLSGVYDTKAYPITIALNSNDPYAYSESIVKALESGYALTLSTENSGVAHAYTLWGAEYQITSNGYELTKVWLTNSDDIKNDPAIFYKNVVCTSSPKGGSVAFDENMGATLTAVAGLRTDPKLVPEPAATSLALAALLGMLGRRRRK